MKTFFSKKAILLSSALAIAATGCSSSVIRLSGAGASFPQQIYTSWFKDLSEDGEISVNYQAVGSGSGRKAFIDETVDFAASDDPMKDSDIALVDRGLVQIPMVGGSIAFGYNYDCDLKLTQEDAVKVAMGIITDWKELGCPPGQITWVHRSDGSGTTKAFTASMDAFSRLWTLGVGKSVEWVTGVGGKGNSGVAGIIETTYGAIGYVNQSYIRGNITAAALENREGQFVYPTSESGAIALNGIKLDDNLAGRDPNPRGDGAYPISTLTWILAYETGNGENTEAIKEMLSALLSDEYQAKAITLDFIPLKGDILERAREAINLIKE